ncbi:NlpC/P60 family protein [Geodermatophilus marinus]|uniref:NlpC/P60 family protein n=1 Tax=Geodermatophilus sp. LHW52908 TaxID=2303986 RepID=UPI000E3E38F7|nr:NlpC/P60 family protein [Geodermatophilus sp. LHW52908]RFU22891.1 hydrolase [Geodermatophilus sp. LHW52908]
MPAPRTTAPRRGTPTGRAPAPARSGRRPQPGTRTPTSTGAARPPLTPREAEALRALLAARAATGGTGPAPQRPRTAGPARRRPAGRRRPRRRTRRPGAGARRWSQRLAVAALGLVLPVLAGLLAPGTQPTGSAGEPVDGPGLALAAQSRLQEGAARYRQAAQELGERQDDLQRAAEAEQTARERLAAARVTVGARAADRYTAAPSLAHPLTGLDLSDPAATADVLWAQALADRGAAELQRLAVRAERAATDLGTARRRAAEARAAAELAARTAGAALEGVRAEAAGLAPDVAAQLAALGTATAAGEQQARNADALRRWQEQLGLLAAAGIDPPPAADLADPADLPSGLSPLLDAAGQPVPGVAVAVAGNRPVTVLPAETVAAVSSALAQLGEPYAPGGAGPDVHDCGGFTAGSWLLGGHALPAAAADQWSTGAAVPVAQLQVGDLVFADGGLDVALYLGDGQVVGASAATYQVGVRPLTGVAGAVRVTLAAPAAPNAALPAGTAGRGPCGAPPAPVGPVSPAWGGWSNGEIPASALCPIARGHALRCDAAAGYAALAEAFAAEFDRPLCITDSYRSLEAQVTAARVKPRLAAAPGTSHHGWGLAVDLCGGINVAGTVESRWMAASAGAFGFVQPGWAQPGGEKPEPWHWEFGHLA